MTTCSRCQRTDSRPLPGPTAIPDGWEGSHLEPVCPGCQLAAWHPHCTSVVDFHGERVDVAAIPRKEWGVGLLMHCGYLDTSVSYYSDELPDAWACPDCGGTEFELVHADYQQSGLRPGGFRAEF